MKNFQFFPRSQSDRDPGLRGLGTIFNFQNPKGKDRDLPSIIFQILKNDAGFTLIEVVVAFAVIMAALIGPVVLITRGLTDITSARNRLVALNLAQEGIELVRVVRDNNILCDYLDGGAEGSVEWNHDPGGGPGFITDNPQPRRADVLTFVSVLSPSVGACDSRVQSPLFQGGANQFLRINPQGFYQYGGAGVDSVFTRKISINIVVLPSPPYVGGRPDRMEITSVVEWTERGRLRTVTLKDALYNWR